jgi:Protein of unknown function (DUF3040)
MPLSGYEQRRWRELEAQLAQEQRLVRLAARLGQAGRDARGPSRASALWAVGGGLGLALAIAGAVLHNTILNFAGVALLAATLVLVGIALIVLGLGHSRRDRRSAPRWEAQPPSR